MLGRLDGCITAIVTPFGPDGLVNVDALDQLLEFQLANGVRGTVVAGTTGEGPTLDHQEFLKALAFVLERTGERGLTVASTGTNSTSRALAATVEARKLGAPAALLVDPYYNCPSSIEIRREYYEPIAEAVGDMVVIPYIIPGRTGTQIAPQDVALLVKKCPNVRAVKEATGSSENAAAIRALCGNSISILSGDDEKTYGLMADPLVRGEGAISVMSNIAPKAVSDMISALASRDIERADRLAASLKPLFELVTVKTEETVMGRPMTVKAKNPVPVKSIAAVLGMPAGPCRRPLGKLTKGGLAKVVASLRLIWERNPEVLEPIERGFGVDLGDRLESPTSLVGLCYED
jgi:4-hydroxy-tetrahydrodipicolinate synthase